MSEETVVLAICIAFVTGVYLGIRESANAVLHNGRHWWMRQVYLAQQRIDYAEFSKQLDEVDQLERMGME